MEDLGSDLGDRTREIYESSSTTIPISHGCEISEIVITKIDKENNRYEGHITLIDHFEHGTFTDRWVAESGKQEHTISGRKYLLSIIPSESGFGSEFTGLPNVNRDMKHHIIKAILKVNPDLPYEE